MSGMVIFILTTTTALAALTPRVEGQSSNVENSMDGRSYIIKTTADYSTMKSTVAPPDEKDKWLIYVSAGPTVFIFLICVIAISVKNCSSVEKYSQEDEGVLNPTATTVPTSPIALLKPKPKIINEVYDKMLEQFKDDKNKNKTFVGRKCSQIHIQGVESGSPKSLARKHIIIGKLSTNDDVIEEEEEDDPIRTLVETSTRTMVRPLIKEIRGQQESIQSDDTLEIKDQVQKILKTSIDDLTEADRRTYCDEINEVLLPEDLEEAFKNFEFWAESYA